MKQSTLRRDVTTPYDGDPFDFPCVRRDMQDNVERDSDINKDLFSDFVLVLIRYISECTFRYKIDTTTRLGGLDSVRKGTDKGVDINSRPLSEGLI